MTADESEIPLLSRNFSKITRLRILRNRGMIVPTDGRPKRFLKQIYLYAALKDSEKNTIAKYYSDKYAKQYKPASTLRISSKDMESALKIFNLVRNQCAHDERLFNSDYKNIRVSNMANYYGIENYNNRRIFVAILYFKVLFNKSYYKKFYSELSEIFAKYKNEFQTVSFNDILNSMGIDLSELEKLI